MEKEFVPYEIALRLKELGFDERCFAIFYQEKFMNGHIEPYVWNLVNSIKTNSDCNSIDIVTAPLWQQVIDWFDNKNIIIGIDINPGTLFYRVHLYKRYYHNPGRLVIRKYFLSGEFNNFISKEEAREQAILKAIELCQK